MSRAVFWSVFGAALALALWFRLSDLGVRPMHHDEANQAVRFGILLETGEYRYDRHDHHGPTLYYLTLPAAWARGQRSLAALDERTIRMVPALFGAAFLLLFLPLSSGIGRAGVASAAALAAVSPALTYYSRFYIQETLFVFFATGFLIALGRYALRPGMAASAWAGVLAGLAYATKETSLIVLPVAAVACATALVIARHAEGGQTPPVTVPGSDPRTGVRPPYRALHGMRVRHLLVAIAAGLVVTLLLYSAFLRNPSGLLDSFGAVSIYLARGVGPGPHVQPWFYYLRILGWSSSGGLVWTDALVLVLALAGFVHAVAARKTSFWPLYLCLYTVATTAVFSAVPYKTPWNLLPFYAGLILTAGVGVNTILSHARRPALRTAVVVVLVAAGWQLAAQSRRASLRYAADPRNPYVYAHTTTDYLRLVTRVHDLAAVHADGRAMLVKVVAGPYEQWPFPWYARDLTRVGYWTRADEAAPLDGTPVILASDENAAAVEAAVGDRYVTEYYGLRPDVLVTLFIERGLWDRFLAARQ
jgi:uncharacterized protein (TIGR03663 family)